MAAARPIWSSPEEKPMRQKSRLAAGDAGVHFDVWGCRGSRNLVPRRSRIGNHTSCYSVLSGEDLLVFDAGRGLAALGYAINTEARFRQVKRVHILVTHAHMDHWEGLKDADWFWQKNNGLQIRILGNRETLGAIKEAYSHPLYVSLELLAMGTVARLGFELLAAGQRRTVGGWAVRTGVLNHYSGQGRSRRTLDTLGYRISRRGGPTIAYLSDHEPNAATVRSEAQLIEGANLAVYDSHFPDIRQQTHGHGSQEHSAGVARLHPELLVIAAHHAPSLSDAQIRAAHRRHGRGLGNFHVAVEGRTYRWDPRRATFTTSPRPVA